MKENRLCLLPRLLAVTALAASVPGCASRLSFVASESYPTPDPSHTIQTPDGVCFGPYLISREGGVANIGCKSFVSSGLEVAPQIECDDTFDFGQRQNQEIYHISVCRPAGNGNGVSARILTSTQATEETDDGLTGTAEAVTP